VVGARNYFLLLNTQTGFGVYLTPSSKDTGVLSQE
jgi:hypothetical protein